MAFNRSLSSGQALRTLVKEVRLRVLVQEESFRQSSVSTGDVKCSETGTSCDGTEKQLQNLDRAMMTGLHLRSLDFVGPDTNRIGPGLAVVSLSIQQVLHYLWPELMIIEKLLNLLRGSLQP